MKCGLSRSGPRSANGRRGDLSADRSAGSGENRPNSRLRRGCLRRRRGFLVAMVALVTVSCSPTPSTSPPRPSGSHGSGGAAAPSDAKDDPYQVGGSSMPLSQAQANMPFAIVLPQTPTANDENLTGVWATPALGENSQVALEYQSGLLWIIEYPTNESQTSAKALFLANASDFNGSLDRSVFSVEDVGGIPLLVGQANMDYDQNAPASVGSVSGGIDVTFYSRTLSPEDLVRVATDAWGVNGDQATFLRIPPYTPPTLATGEPSPAGSAG